MPSKPMAGVKILEVAQFTYGPAAGGVLSDWGADVIKIEHSVTGDAQRGIQVGFAGTKVGSFHPIMDHPNHGKRSVGLDLAHPRGHEILMDLVRQSDVFLTNFLPGAREKLHIDVDDIRAVNPRIVYARATALGPRGPEADKGGYDSSVFWARGASAAQVAPPDFDRLMAMPAGAYGDSMGGMTIAGGISAALFAREKTGEGSVIDVALLSVAAWQMGLWVNLALLTDTVPASNTPPAGSALASPNPLGAAYRTSDDRWIQMTMLQPGRYWEDLCRHLDRADLLDDERFTNFESMIQHGPEATEIVGAEIAKRSFAEWSERFRTLEGQWAPVQNALELGHDPQLRANGWIGKITDADGVERELVANPVQFDETPAELERGPLFAEHTDEVMRELGFGDDELLQLKIDGVIT
jgi:crotonobetainyl-CoA:carnitine CoA-transferase CaiB-like acyl-CoA transferase